MHRFPYDFLFQLTQKEKDEVVTNYDHFRYLKYSPFLPLAFTEHRAIMAASVLNSERAILVSVSSADLKGYQAIKGTAEKADYENSFADR